MKSDFILLDVIASNLDSSTITELVNAERYAISLSTVQTGTADLDHTKHPEYQRSIFCQERVHAMELCNVPPPASHYVTGKSVISYLSLNKEETRGEIFPLGTRA